MGWESGWVEKVGGLGGWMGWEGGWVGRVGGLGGWVGWEGGRGKRLERCLEGCLERGLESCSESKMIKVTSRDGSDPHKRLTSHRARSTATQGHHSTHPLPSCLSCCQVAACGCFPFGVLKARWASAPSVTLFRCIVLSFMFFSCIVMSFFVFLLYCFCMEYFVFYFIVRYF